MKEMLIAKCSDTIGIHTGSLWGLHTGYDLPEMKADWRSLHPDTKPCSSYLCARSNTQTKL